MSEYYPTLLVIIVFLGSYLAFIPFLKKHSHKLPLKTKTHEDGETIRGVYFTNFVLLSMIHFVVTFTVLFMLLWFVTGQK